MAARQRYEQLETGIIVQNIVILIISATAAFAIGFLINRGGTCAVAASRDLLSGREIDLFVGFLMAAASAGMVTLPLRDWLAVAEGSGVMPFGVTVLAGASLVAIGAVLNDACLLGSLWRLGNGETRLLLLPIGLAVGFWLAQQLGIQAHVSAKQVMHLPTIWVVLGFACLLAMSLFTMHRWGCGRMAGSISLSASMILLGLFGSILFILHPGWTYADMVYYLVEPTMERLPFTLPLVIPALMTILGAGIAAQLSGQFALKRPTLVSVARTLGGGFFMATGATMIPGGNDSLLLGAVPTGSSAAILAYLIVSALVLVALLALRGLRINSAITL